MTLVADAKSDEVPPEVTEEIDGIESNLKVRQRRRRRRQVAAAPEEKKPPPPSSPPPPTPAPVQQLPEEASVEPEEPENPPQELGKVRLPRGFSTFTDLLSSLVPSSGHRQC